VAVPTGLIAIWTGTIANIPANWNLCDGSGVTPDLRERFIRGASAVQNPGTVGGTTNHTHASSTLAGTHTHTTSAHPAGHTHTTASGGSHGHGYIDLEGILADYYCMELYAGNHSHTTTSTTGPAHGNLTTDPNHTHTINTEIHDPPYYNVVYIQAAAGAAIANSIIIIWTGTLANIPAGWELCDGVGRPNLLERFIKGQLAGDPAGGANVSTHIHTVVARAHNHGAVTPTSANHTHTVTVASPGTHNHLGGTLKIATGTSSVVSDSHTFTHGHTMGSDGGHSHTVGSAGSHQHTVDPASHIPPYYEVAYIVAVGATSVPNNGILIWTGTRGNIPADYDEVTALREKFLRCVDAYTDPSGTGGAVSHTHTENGTAGGHAAHAIGNTNAAHNHNYTNYAGNHTHTGTARGAPMFMVSAPSQPNNSGGSHRHNTNNNVDTHNHTLGAATVGAHDHEPWSTDDVLPAYMNVAFVIHVALARKSSFFMMWEE